MASKLFRAVVGFGIGLGATSAACFGATEGGIVGTTAEAVPDGSTSAVPSPSSSGTTTADPGPGPAPTPNDASFDVTVVADAGVDAPKDVGADAFCDAAWPTTKGNPKPPACTDPNDECVDAGSPGYCVPVGDAGTCEWSGTFAPFCVNQEWRCQPGTIDWGSCP
jgi:hypothetical protein